MPDLREVSSREPSLFHACGAAIRSLERSLGGTLTFARNLTLWTRT